MNNFKFKTIFAIAILILAGTGGYFLNQKSSPPEQIPTADYADQSKWKLLADEEYSPSDHATRGYAVSYPRDFDVYRAESASGGFLGVPSAEIRFPEDAFPYPKTNFVEAYLTTSIGNDPDSLKNCYANPNPEDGAPKTLTNTATINGNIFYKGAGSGGDGAGNIYASELYRTLANDRCYEFVLTVHTGNIGDSAPGTVAEFDKEKAFGVLRQILQTVHFYTKTKNGAKQ